VRKGRFLNVGAGRLAPGSLPDDIRALTDRLRTRGGVLPATPRWKGHAYLLNRVSRRALTAPQALVIGDAAGLALTPSGEGILTAIESGLIAADVIVAARDDYSPTRLAAYERRITRRFEARAAGLRSIPRWIAVSASALLLRAPWLTRRVLLEDGFLHMRRADLTI